MPAKPQYIHDIDASVKLLTFGMDDIRNRIAELSKSLDGAQQAKHDLRPELHVELSTNNQALKDSLADLRHELALAKQQLADTNQRIEEWDRRWWGFVVVLIGALLSLASGLIVTLARK
jgi:predicted  nucleic acid-binding Zn-ribbon protein